MMAARATIHDLTGPRGGTGRRSRTALAAVACAALLVGGCNSGAVGDGSGGGGGGNGGGGNGRGNGGGGNGGGGNGTSRYGFGLPSGPTGGDAPAGAVYEDILGKNCAQAEQDSRAETLEGSDYLPLLRIGIALCRGDLSSAQQDLASLARPSWDSNTWFMCELYRAAESFVHQRPRSAYGTCPSPPVEPSESSSPDEGGSSGPVDSSQPSDSSQSSPGTGG